MIYDNIGIKSKYFLDAALIVDMMDNEHGFTIQTMDCVKESQVV